MEYIQTNFENASPLNWEIDSSGRVAISLVYDHERSSVNRANGHWLFQVQGREGSDITLILGGFDNIWNGRHAQAVYPRTHCYASADGRVWDTIPAALTEDGRLQVRLHMSSDALYLAGMEPYRISDLENLLKEIAAKPLVQISRIGHTCEGRPLEMVRVGDTNAPFRVFIRARAHGYEAGGNWLVQGMIRTLLHPGAKAGKYLRRYCLYILPMANKDAVAHGKTRFNSMGVDLNRNWDKPHDSGYAPENTAVEQWIKKMIAHDKKPALAIDVHNDGDGNLHISPAGDHTRYPGNMARMEGLLHALTWYTGHRVGGEDRLAKASSMNDGLLARYGIEGFVFELNSQWIDRLHKAPFGKDWELLGQQFCEVLYTYFAETIKPPASR